MSPFRFEIDPAMNHARLEKARGIQEICPATELVEEDKQALPQPKQTATNIDQSTSHSFSEFVCSLVATP
jgi:hypothetical protein